MPPFSVQANISSFCKRRRKIRKCLDESFGATKLAEFSHRSYGLSGLPTAAAFGDLQSPPPRRRPRRAVMFQQPTFVTEACPNQADGFNYMATNSMDIDEPEGSCVHCPSAQLMGHQRPATPAAHSCLSQPPQPAAAGPFLRSHASAARRRAHDSCQRSYGNNHSGAAGGALQPPSQCGPYAAASSSCGGGDPISPPRPLWKPHTFSIQRSPAGAAGAQAVVVKIDKPGCTPFPEVKGQRYAGTADVSNLANQLLGFNMRSPLRRSGARFDAGS